MEQEVYKKGEYVVLLASCDGGNCWHDEMPINHVYKLRNKCNKLKFNVELDIRGSKFNGWAVTNYNSKLRLRLATFSEKQAYIKNKGPLHMVETLEVEVQTLDNYQMY